MSVEESPAASPSAREEARPASPGSDASPPAARQPASLLTELGTSLRRRRIKDALLCISLANLCFIQAWFCVLYVGHHGFFSQRPVTAMTLLALLLNVAGAALLFWLAAQWVRRREERIVRFMADTALCLLLLVPLNFVRITCFSFPGTAIEVWARKPAAIFLGLVVAGMFVYW